MDRRNFILASSGYALSALGLPDMDSITRRTTTVSPGAVRVGRGEVAAVRHMVKALGDSASELGGGHARHLAVRYLTQDVAPWLEGRFTEATGRELFAATSQLVHLAGWMAQDEGGTPELRGLAQGYYAHSFRLAAEAGDAELSATALRGLAVQCVDLGYRAEAVQLGEACVEYGRHLDNPRAVAYYEATLANAAAQDGDRHMATKHLATSETAIGRPAAEGGDSWAAHYSPGRWAHESGMILSSGARGCHAHGVVQPPEGRRRAPGEDGGRALARAVSAAAAAVRFRAAAGARFRAGAGGRGRAACALARAAASSSAASGISTWPRR
ncbi:tetratricopeptide repeat protein [Streptomyces sp. NPDC088729]|uniref:tetratricopeptide repeat protein n=1 Tax=Streptomyces sp. NPDC088729 TaxID=3365876 RepID=UPI00382F034F